MCAYCGIFATDLTHVLASACIENLSMHLVIEHVHADWHFHSSIAEFNRHSMLHCFVYESFGGTLLSSSILHLYTNHLQSFRALMILVVFNTNVRAAVHNVVKITPSLLNLIHAYNPNEACV